MYCNFMQHSLQLFCKLKPYYTCKFFCVTKVAKLGSLCKFQSWNMPLTRTCSLCGRKEKRIGREEEKKQYYIIAQHVIPQCVTVVYIVFSEGEWDQSPKASRYQ